jgi:branched-chain amino acid transport system substrate-binding protein
MKKALLAALAVLGLSVAAAAAAGAPASSARPDVAASPAAAERALIRCGRTRSIGVAAPLTGLAASLGQQQIKWVRFYVSRYNRSHRRTKFRIVSGDTQLPDTAQAIQVAERLSSNSQVLGVVGPAGSQEVQVSSAPFRSAGLGYVSGSATRTSLTNDGTRRGRFFRVVPNDDQQGPRVVQHIRRELNATRIVVVDAQNSYSTGLSDFVERALRAQSGVTVQRESVDEANVTDFSSLVTRIPANTQVVYVPWQVSSKAQLFGQQLRAAGKNATLFGSDGLFDPDNFKIPGSLVSFFPLDLQSSLIAAYRSGPGGGKSDLRAPELRRGRSGRACDREGVSERHGDASRGATQHRSDQHPQAAVSAWLSDPLRPARRRPARPGRHAAARRLRHLPDQQHRRLLPHRVRRPSGMK